MKRGNVVPGDRLSTSSAGYFEISPKRQMKRVAAKDEKTEEKPVLILKPFAARPQISFQQVLINTQIKKNLYIQNPDPVEVTVEVLSAPPKDRNLQLGTTVFVVPPKSEVELPLTWCPREPGTWFDTLTIKDTRGRRGAVAISYEAIAPKQPRGAGRGTRGVRRGTASSVPSRQPGRPAFKTAAKPQWKVPQPSKPREAFKPTATEQNTWRTYDVNTAEELSSIGLPATPFRRETYVLPSGNGAQRKSAENKENCSRTGPSEVVPSLDSPVCVTPAFSVYTDQHEPSTPVTLERHQFRLPESDANISTDSLDISPAKPFKGKPKSNFLQLLQQDYMCSPVVTKKPCQEESKTVQDTFINERFSQNSTLFEGEFIETNIASFSDMTSRDLSFADRRCSTAFKELANRQVSPRARRVSPRELFDVSAERRLSSDTYVVSASNSLEGCSGESMLAAPSPKQQRLAQVLEVTELTEAIEDESLTELVDQQKDAPVIIEEQISEVEQSSECEVTKATKQEWSMRLRSRNSSQKIMHVTMLTEEQISGTPQMGNKQTPTEAQEFFMKVSRGNSNQQIQVTVRPEEQISGIDFDQSIEATEVQQKIVRNVKPSKSAPICLEISPPSKQITGVVEKPNIQQKVAPMDLNGSVAFQISPPKKSVPNEVTELPQKSSASTTYTLRTANPDASVYLEISPPKQVVPPSVQWRKEISTASMDTKDKTYTKTNEEILQNQTYNVASSSTSNKRVMLVPVSTSKKLKLDSTQQEPTRETQNPNVSDQDYQDGENIHDPDLFLYEYAITGASAPGMKKDPFHLNPMLHDAWLEKCDVEFKKWLNAVVTLPEELATEEVAKVNAAELWARSTRAGTHEQLAPSRELVSTRYLSVKTRLDQLRHAALTLFRQPEVAEILCRVNARVESNKIKIRDDKALHLDQGLKQHVLQLFLSYNPLWLRLGLETVVGKIIPLEGNAVIGLSNFIVHRVLCVEALLGKSHLVLKTEFKEKFNRYVLKKFLLLVYFLDQAKTRKLIRHDPCLFRKDSSVKSSKDMLLSFSRQLLAGEGDLTKHLGYMGYRVSHVQGYLDEFNYSVNHLGVDLRDGVRITRVVELVTGCSGLSTKLRVPAGSRLQKVHNVEVALQGLEQAGYAVQNVKAVDIVAGHREKTLSMLWQIVHNFQAPRFEKAARIIQNWWLKPSLKTVIARRMHKRVRDKAVVTIQRFVRGYLCRKNFETLKQAAKMEQHKNAMACIIQKNLRVFMLKRRLTKLANWNIMEKAAQIIQRNFRAFLAKKLLQTLKIQDQIRKAAKNETAALKIQSYWQCYRAKKILRELRQQQKIQRNNAAVKIQYFFRCFLAKKILHELQSEARKKENATVVLQCAWRSHCAKKILCQLKREHKEKIKTAALIIQCSWRSFSARQELIKLKRDYENKKEAAIKIQLAWRCFVAKKILSQLKKEDTEKKRNAAALVIQGLWRSFSARQELTKLQLDYENKKQTNAIKIQLAWRCFVAKKILSQLKKEDTEKKRNAAALVIQCLWRSFSARQELTKLKLDYENKKKEAAVIIQCVWRCFVAKKILSQLKKEEMEKKRNAAALVIQCSWRSFSARQELTKLKIDYKNKKNEAAIKIQCVWRCFVAKKILSQLKKEDMEKKRNAAALVIQCLWRSFSARQELTKLKIDYENKKQTAAVKIQLVWRCFIAKKTLSHLKKEDIEKKRNAAALVIQCLWRSFSARQELTKLQLDYENKKQTNAIKIQLAWRCFVAKKTLSHLKKEDTEKKRNAAALVIQCSWRSFSARQELTKLKIDYENKKNEAAIKIQCVWRCFVAKKILSHLKKEDMEKKRNAAALIIQCLWRSFFARQELTKLKIDYENKKQTAAVKIQCVWRCFIAKKTLSHLKNEDTEKKRNAAALVIQCSWRSFSARQELTKLKLYYKNKKNEAAIKIQCVWRCFVAKKILSQLKKEDIEKKRNAAALVIQCLWRSFSARQELTKLQLDYENKKQTNAIKIQLAWRCFVAKKILSHLKKEDTEKKRNAAALVIQCSWRSFSARQELTKLKLDYKNKKNEAAIKIQCVWRCFVAKKILSQLKKEDMEKKRNAAALVIQCSWRSFFARQELTKLQLDYENKKQTSAIKIQCVWRCFVSKKILFQLKKEDTVKKRNAAALVIQCWWRSFSARQELTKLKRDYENKKDSAIKIQCAWRCYCARKTLIQLKSTDMRKQNSAALLIQSCWRSFTAKKLAQELRGAKLVKFHVERETTAAIIIQKAVRIWMWKQAVSRYFIERENTLVSHTILKSWEEHLLRQPLNMTMIASILRQQSCLKQRQNLAAKIIQTFWKRFVGKRNNAATKIQAAWRGFKCRHNNRQAAAAHKPVTIEMEDGEITVVITAELVAKVVHKHECILEAKKNAKVEDRIARKIQLALELLGKTLGHDIYAMSIFDTYLTVTGECVPLIIPALDYIVSLLTSNNRSVPSMEAAETASCALVSLAKHPDSKPALWQHSKIIPALLLSVVVCKDTNEKLFNNACTILWLMALDPAKRDDLRGQSGLEFRLQSISKHIQGRQRCARSLRSQAAHLLPTPRMPELRFNKEPRCFSSRLHGLHSLMKLLNVEIPSAKTK